VLNSPATPKLALCIPTYNRGAYIEQAIRSIAANMPRSGVEMVVIDNHSTDDTEAVVTGLLPQIPHLRYFRRDVNVGADRNIVEAAEFTEADYFWVFGSDDTMPPGAIDVVLQAIADDKPNVVLGDANDVDVELRQTGVLKFLKGGPRDFALREHGEVMDFLDATTMTASLFGFISSMVYKRSAWQRIPVSLYTYGTAYAQVFRALDLVFRIEGGCRYLARPIANNRRNNCSYTAEFGEMQRYLIDFRMFRMVIDEYFSTDLQVRNRFKQFVRSCFGRMAHEQIRTGMFVMDELLKFFEVDDAAMPEIKHWERYPLVERACHRFEADGNYRDLFDGKKILHLAYRHEAEATIKPVNKNAIGVDAGYSGYDGVRLPFETAQTDTVYLSDWFPAKVDAAKAAGEWLRVLKPEGCIVVSNKLEGKAALSALLTQLEQLLPNCQVMLCRHAEEGAEADVILRKPAASIEQMLGEAGSLLQHGKPAEAEALLVRVLERVPRDVHVLQQLGLLAYQSGRHGDAILRFTAALSIEPALPEAHLNLGCAYAALGGNAEAMQCFSAALNFRHDFAAAAQNLAFLRANTAREAALRAPFEQMLREHPLLAAAHQALGMGELA
jgi:abequosyltransferase